MMDGATHSVEKVKTRSVKKQRVIIELNKDALDVLEDLQERTSAGTRAELVRNLIRHAAMMADEIKEGNSPVWIDQDGKVSKIPIHKALFFPIHKALFLKCCA